MEAKHDLRIAWSVAGADEGIDKDEITRLEISSIGGSRSEDAAYTDVTGGEGDGKGEVGDQAREVVALGGLDRGVKDFDKNGAGSRRDGDMGRFYREGWGVGDGFKNQRL